MRQEGWKVEPFFNMSGLQKEGHRHLTTEPSEPSLGWPRGHHDFTKHSIRPCSLSCTPRFLHQEDSPHQIHGLFFFLLIPSGAQKQKLLNPQIRRQFHSPEVVREFLLFHSHPIHKQKILQQVSRCGLLQRSGKRDAWERLWKLSTRPDYCEKHICGYVYIYIHIYACLPYMILYVHCTVCTVLIYVVYWFSVYPLQATECHKSLPARCSKAATRQPTAS